MIDFDRFALISSYGVHRLVSSLFSPAARKFSASINWKEATRQRRDSVYSHSAKIMTVN